jgi:hypothetical protein
MYVYLMWALSSPVRSKGKPHNLSTARTITKTTNTAPSPHARNSSRPYLEAFKHGGGTG